MTDRAATVSIVLFALVATWARVTVPIVGVDLPLVLLVAPLCLAAVTAAIVRSGSLIGVVPAAVAVLGLLMVLRSASIAAGLLEPMFAPLVRAALEPLVAGVLYAAIAFTTGWWLATHPDRQMRRLVVAGSLVVGVVVNCVVSLVQVGRFAAGSDAVTGINVATGVPRAQGLSSDPNHLALGVVLVLPLLVAVRWHWLPRLGAGVMLVGGLAATGSRSGLLAACIAGVLLLLVHLPGRLRRLRLTAPSGARRPAVRGPLRSAAVALVLCVAAVWPVVAIDSATPGSFADLISRDVPGRSAGTEADRTGATHLGVYGLAPDWLEDEGAWFGSGAGSFATRFELLTGRGGFGAHSWYLRALLETGIAGLFVALLLLAHVTACAAATGTALGRAVFVSIIATAVGNVSYLTMHLATWHLLVALAVSGAAFGASGSIRDARADQGLRAPS